MLGPVGEGWKVAMATLGFERGTAFLSQQLAFEHEFTELLDVARKRGVSNDPVLRDELANRYVGLQVMRFNGMRMLTNMLKQGALGPEASIGKLFWTSWHRRFGETGMDVIGADGLFVDEAGDGNVRARRRAPEFSWRAARRRSTPVRARSNTTSSVSACWDSHASPAEQEHNNVNFAFSDEQEQLRDAVRRFLEAKSPSTEVRRLMETTEGYDPAVWNQMANELGLQSLAIPEEYGGQGFTFVELGIVLEEMGRVLLCAPYFSTVVLAADAILNAGTDAEKQALLPGHRVG